MSILPKCTTVASTNRRGVSRSARSPFRAIVRLPIFAIVSQVPSGDRVLPWHATSAPASASVIAISAPSPADEPVTSAILSSSLKESSIKSVTGRSLPPSGTDSGVRGCDSQKVFSNRSEDIDQHNLFVERCGSVPAAGREVQHIARPGDALLIADYEAHPASFYEGDLFVRMFVGGCREIRRKSETADH